MGYAEDIQLAARWIAERQDPHDGGWGLAANQASSLVNTAEAIDVLWESKTCLEECRRGIAFLKENTFIHAQPRTSKESVGRGARVRYVALPLSVLSLTNDESHRLHIHRCRDWLIDARNPDFGWGDEANDKASKLFPTFLAIRALQDAQAIEELEKSYMWVCAQSTSEGWSLYPNYPTSPLATAYGVLCLTRSPFRSDERVSRAGKFLLQTKSWHPITDDVTGTVWQHSTCAWVLSALAELGEPPYSPTMAEGIRYLNSLKRREGAPWAETPEHHAFSIRSQYWAVVALRALRQSFDPSVHAPRIDADRATDQLTEPAYLKFVIRSAWAIVVPARLYEFATYGCFAAALIFAFSLYRVFPSLSKEADLVIAMLLFALGWQAMRLRRKAFPQKARTVAKWIVAIGAVGALFGKDSYTILSGVVEFVQNLLRSALGHIKAMYSSIAKAE